MQNDTAPRTPWEWKRKGSALPEQRNGRIKPGGLIRRAALTLAIACCGLTQSALAEVSISGTPSAVRVEARQASVDEVLRALGTSFKLRYSATGAIGGMVSGTYSGSLPSVVARILGGQNYFMHGPADDLEVRILTAGAPAAQPTARVAPAKPGAAAAPPVGMDPVKECKYNGIPVEC